MGESVKLITITPDAEQIILYIARASSNQESEDVGLIRFLIGQNHWSPFSCAHAVIEMNTSRTIAHQVIRHWSIACMEAGEPPGLQEFSQRYAVPTETVIYKARRQAEVNRQSSVDDLDQETIAWFDNAQHMVKEYCFSVYNLALSRGIAKESARFLLPESVMTKLYLSGSIRSWIHYFRERCKEDCQQEHRVLALEARKLISVHVPTIAKALEWET